MNESWKADNGSGSISKNSEQHAQKGNGRNMSTGAIKNPNYHEEDQNLISNIESGLPEKRLQNMPSVAVKKCVTFTQVRENFESLILKISLILKKATKLLSQRHCFENNTDIVIRICEQG